MLELIYLVFGFKFDNFVKLIFYKLGIEKKIQRASN